MISIYLLLDEVGIFNKSLIIIRLYGACGRSKERPYGLWDDWCEAGTRRGHYNWRWFGADTRTSVPTACGMTGARPAQGTATTTGDGLVRSLERASLRVECDEGIR